MKQNFTRLLTLVVFLFFSLTSYSQKIEAESAELTGDATVVNSSSASGGAYVAQNEGNLTFNVSVSEEGFYNLYINAAAPNGEKDNDISINGSSSVFHLESNPEYKTLKVVSNYKLSAGQHVIEIIKSWGWINIDYISLEKVDASNRFDLNQSLVTSNPTREAAGLYKFLLDNYGQKIISGVMTLNSFDETDWLKQNTGKEPALLGLDFMHCGRNYTWYDDMEPVNDAITWYNKNGIPTFCWHWRDPLRNTEAFYADETDFDVSKVFDETSPEYQAMIDDIDYVSGLLKELQNNDVPIIWRPLHEAAGGWFWWGAKGAEPCKRLYQIMYDRMVNHHSLKNLLWVWTREPNDEAWYPGDEYVDIVGRDIYKQGDHGSQTIEFNNMNELYGGKKMLTISECGSFPDVDNLTADEAAWSWFMPWYGEFTRDPAYNSLELWQKMFDSGYVITLDEMPDLSTYGTITNTANRDKPKNLSVYPSLVNNRVNIESKYILRKIKVYNNSGKVVIEKLVPGNNAQISLESLKPGLYFIQAGDSEPVKVMKK